MIKSYQQIILAILLPTCWVGCTNNQDEPTSSTTNYGDDSSDFVDEQTWNTTIQLVWNGTEVIVIGVADSVTVTNDNGYVTVNSSAKHVEYAVSGNGTGQLSLYSSYKFKLSLNGLTLHCSNGPAINNQGKKTCYVVLSGDNVLSDAASYASSSDEDRKAAFFSEGQLAISGDGSLTVIGNYKHALASDDYIRFCEGTGNINLTATVKDGIHANDGVIINGGTITVHAAYEGIECNENSVVITGGIVYIEASDDAINAAGEMIISGGHVMAYSTGNDGLDANGNCYITGGVVYAIGASAPEVAIDANTEGGYKLYVEGGTIVALGGLESGSSLAQSCYAAASVSKDTWYALYNGNDVALVFKTPAKVNASTLVVSTSDTPVLKSGVTTEGGNTILNGYGLTSATVSGGSEVSLSSYTGGNAGGGPGDGGPGGGDPGGGGPGGGGPGGERH